MGKTFLLQHFLGRKRAIYHTGTQRASHVELAALSDRVREVLSPGPRDLLATGDFRSWEEAFEYLGAAAGRQRLAVVLDEFSYLVESEPALPAIIQRFWDTTGRTSKLRLFLCGSVAPVLEALGEARAPLFGRFTARLHVLPFSYRDAAAFHPQLEAETAAIAYGVLGGMPQYLQMWEPGAPARENLQRLFGDPTSPLISEGELVLRTELPDASGYFRIMAAVADGRTTYSEIRDEVRMEPARSLDRLLAIRLLERRVPVTGVPHRTRVRSYRILDNFLAFWFRFVYPHRGEIERGLGPAVVRRLMIPFLDDHMGGIFEEMCREYIRLEAPRVGRLPTDITRVGSWWTADGQAEIDVVALRGKEVVVAGEAKWARRVDRRVLFRLREKAGLLPRRAQDMRLVLFGREDFDDPGDASVLTVPLGELY